MSSNKIPLTNSYFIVIIFALLIPSGDGRVFRERDFGTEDGDGLIDNDPGDDLTAKLFLAGVSLFVICLVISCLCRCIREINEDSQDITRIVIEPQYQYPYSPQGTERTGPQQGIYNPGFPSGHSSPIYIYNASFSPIIDEPPPSYYDVTSTSTQATTQEPPIQQLGMRGNADSS